MSIKATFDSHAIRADGLHIFAVSEAGQEIETIIPRADAQAFDWIQPWDGVEVEEEYVLTEHEQDKRRRREVAKLAEWNALAKGAK